eukprot:UN00364
MYKHPRSSSELIITPQQLFNFTNGNEYKKMIDDYRQNILSFDVTIIVDHIAIDTRFNNAEFIMKINSFYPTTTTTTTIINDVDTNDTVTTQYRQVKDIYTPGVLIHGDKWGKQQQQQEQNNQFQQLQQEQDFINNSNNNNNDGDIDTHHYFTPSSLAASSALVQSTNNIETTTTTPTMHILDVGFIRANQSGIRLYITTTLPNLPNNTIDTNYYNKAKNRDDWHNKNYHNPLLNQHLWSFKSLTFSLTGPYYFRTQNKTNSVTQDACLGCNGNYEYARYNITRNNTQWSTNFSWWHMVQDNDYFQFGITTQTTPILQSYPMPTLPESLQHYTDISALSNSHVIMRGHDINEYVDPYKYYPANDKFYNPYHSELSYYENNITITSPTWEQWGFGVLSTSSYHGNSMKRGIFQWDQFYVYRIEIDLYGIEIHPLPTYINNNNNNNTVDELNDDLYLNTLQNHPIELVTTIDLLTRRDTTPVDEYDNVIQASYLTTIYNIPKNQQQQNNFNNNNTEEEEEQQQQGLQQQQQQWEQIFIPSTFGGIDNTIKDAEFQLLNNTEKYVIGYPDHRRNYYDNHDNYYPSGYYSSISFVIMIIVVGTIGGILICSGLSVGGFWCGQRLCCPTAKVCCWDPVKQTNNNNNQNDSNTIDMLPMQQQQQQQQSPSPSSYNNNSNDNNVVPTAYVTNPYV